MIQKPSADIFPLKIDDLMNTKYLDRIFDQKQNFSTFNNHADFLGSYVRNLQNLYEMNANKMREIGEGLVNAFGKTNEQVGQEVASSNPNDVALYLTDLFQRYVLFLDVLRQRGNNFVQHEQEGCPPVLAYEYDMVVDGSKLDRPVNYSLVAIRPPEGVTVRQNGRPYIIIDPRAGHGSGIGGFKSESEVGVALRGGHPVYFCIFTTQPTPTQTIADVTRAEASFIREVRRRHPQSPKPVIIGNCQGGWAAMILAATNPDLTGPIVINGAPVSYWAGVRGKNPMRYLGGLAGGALPALIMADLGNGRFDGANLVLNFETLNPGNTWWKKYYDVLSDPENQEERYLEFERWWSGFYFMNRDEIKWIVENLFVGNRLVHGNAQLDSRLHVDLRNIRAPIIVFASHGDNITPPQQALNWISDIYASVQEIKARGQRIIYTVHDSIGHLGIFVSAAIAQKEHKEIVSTLKAIEAMAPGLYEMVINHVDGTGDNQRYTISFEARDISDIQKLDDGQDDELAFSAVSRMSRIGCELYSIFLQPAIQALSNESTARMMVNLQPLRVRRFLLSDRNPWMAMIQPWVSYAETHRVQNFQNNPFKIIEGAYATLIQNVMDAFRDQRDLTRETLFTAIYESPAMKKFALNEPKRISEVSGTDLRSVSEVSQALDNIGQGGYAEAVIRMLILLARSRHSVRRDRLERSNELLSSHEPFAALGAATRTRIIQLQSLAVEFEPEQALATLPLLLTDQEDRIRALKQCLFVVGAPEEMNEDTHTTFTLIHECLEVNDTDLIEPASVKVSNKTR